jgi:hypothetical protein
MNDTLVVLTSVAGSLGFALLILGVLLIHARVRP